tara:strand:- start:701 stop:934 length:234 start_codon:yes stop_codon:yes gene_type:complete
MLMPMADTVEEEVLLMVFLHQQEAEVFILQIVQAEVNPLPQEVLVRTLEALLPAEAVVLLLQAEVLVQITTEVEEIN